MTLDYRAIDVDNHYYETVDSCTRHLPKEFKRRGVQMLTEGKRTFAVMGGESINSSPIRRSIRSSNRAVWTCCSAARFPRASTRPR